MAFLDGLKKIVRGDFRTKKSAPKATPKSTKATPKPKPKMTKVKKEVSKPKTKTVTKTEAAPAKEEPSIVKNTSIDSGRSAKTPADRKSGKTAAVAAKKVQRIVEKVPAKPLKRKSSGALNMISKKRKYKSAGIL